jgi:hypothetical protein
VTPLRDRVAPASSVLDLRLFDLRPLQTLKIGGRT